MVGTSQKVDILFVAQDETDIDTIVKYAQRIEIKKVCVLGCEAISKLSYINLLNNSDYKKSFQDIFVSDVLVRDLSGLIHIKAFRKQIQLFFQGHGEKSLFSSLNDARYRLLNGIKLFLVKELTFEESINEFLIPGINSWNKFKNRMNKYSAYIDLLGFHQELQEVQLIIASCEVLFQKVDSFINSGSIEFTENTFSDRMDMLNKIDEVLMKIAAQLDLSNVYV
jgi:hypothetical protein